MESVWFKTIFAILFYSLGFILSVYALWRSRTPQGATAWIIGLLSFPFVAVPAFIIFGRNKFYSYVKKRKKRDKVTEEILEFIDLSKNLHADLPNHYSELRSVIAASQQIDFTNNNKAELLINGKETYQSILEAIDKAKKYILFQFYIFNEDSTGEKFKEALIKKSKEGVKVFFLYDAIGSRLSNYFISELSEAGIKSYPFKSNKNWNTRLQINFRNHRKIVVVDGQIAFVGGLNIGDEYVGLSEIGYWRDTHIKIQGAAALSAQMSFIKDWYWVSEKLLDLDWTVEKYVENHKVCILTTGPADDKEICQLAHIALINMARKKIILTSPYFVPTESFFNSIVMAAIRGVEIHILLPLKNDNILVRAADKIYVEKLLSYGVKFYQYKKGFTHQKVIAIDDH